MEPEVTESLEIERREPEGWSAVAMNRPDVPQTLTELLTRAKDDPKHSYRLVRVTRTIEFVANGKT